MVLIIDLRKCVVYLLLKYTRLCSCLSCVFFFKQKTAYEMRISDWSSDVCSSDLTQPVLVDGGVLYMAPPAQAEDPHLIDKWCFYETFWSMKRAAIYARVSTDGQTISNQMLDLETVAARMGWPIVAVHADEGIPGTQNRERVGEGQSVSVRVERGGRRY